ncbi:MULTISPECIES: HlyD family type I secretion periplasmic adaptor subunit [Sphingomonas]|uniref:HlyD family type I secretion periplasmic adaptor subunit n=1 Tax=Sphingomonas TaxID=13687 RepID=UPI000DEF750F|nr:MULTISPECIES: HlyD family type I secretion periplasmic adaptor subunit [Sphingomonas]
MLTTEANADDGDRNLPAAPGPFASILARVNQPAELTEDEPSHDIRLGAIVAIIFFVLFLGWAALAPLDAAVMAGGKLVVSGQRQTVQHRDGGVVGQLLVHEGQRVSKGQVLIKLAAADVEAQERALSGQAITLLAQRARLRAEQLGSGSIETPVEFASLPTPEERAAAAQALRIQQVQLNSRMQVLRAQRGALSTRTSGSTSMGQGYSSQVAALDQQIKSVTDELNSLADVAAKGFVSQSRIRQLERSRAELQGQRAQYLATAAQTRDQASESRLQSMEASSTYNERSASELRDVEASLSEVLPKLTAARDQLARTEIRSPVDGSVVGLQVFTPGGVIAAGQRVMDVVPDRQPMTIEARIAPSDGEDLQPGQTAYVRFDFLHERALQPLEGKVTRVSADSFTDEKTGETYFTATVIVPQSQLDILKEVRGRDFQLRAGMPVTVEIPVRKRTALAYLLDPLTASFRRFGREH